MKKTIHDTIIVARYDLIMFFRYKSNLVWLVTTPIVFMFIGMILLNVMGVDRFTEFSGGTSKGALYSLIGYGVFSLANYCWQAGSKMEQEMLLGTMKTNFLLPVRRLSYVYGLCFGTLCSTGIFAVIILIIAAILARPKLENLGYILLALGLSILYFLGIAVIMCSVSLRYKRISGLANLLTFVLQLITGMMIPIPAFPPLLQRICYLSPTTWAIDSIRSGLVGTKPLIPQMQELLILLVACIFSNLLGWYLFKSAEASISENGEIEAY